MSSFQSVFRLDRLELDIVIVCFPCIASLKLLLTSPSPFLAFVSSTNQFDSQLGQYVNMSYVQQR